VASSDCVNKDLLAEARKRDRVFLASSDAKSKIVLDVS